MAAFGPADVDRLLGDAGIVRNRAKIEAAIAQRAAWSPRMGPEFADLVWSHADPERPRPTLADWRATSPESVALARALKQRGIRFFGPTTAYAMMQATGLVDDHLADCQVPRVSAVRGRGDPNRLAAVRMRNNRTSTTGSLQMRMRDGSNETADG